MNFRTLSLVAATAVVGLLGCGRKTVAVDSASPTPMAKTKAPETSRLSAAVDAYARAQNPENDAAVRQAMAAVDSEIAGLEDLVAKRHGRDRQKVAAKLRRLEACRSDETTRFAEIQAGPALAAPDPREAPPGIGKADGTARHGTSAIEDPPRKTGGTNNDATR